MISKETTDLIVNELIVIDRPDWMIVRRLYESLHEDVHIKFSLFDDWRWKNELPFGKHQGFISFRDATLPEITTLITSLYDKVADNDVAVANLWILTDRITLRTDSDLLSILKKKLPDTQHKRVYKILVDSLRKQVVNNDAVEPMPLRLKEWQRYINGYDYKAGELAESILFLVSDRRVVGLADLLLLSPRFVGSLIGFWGVRVHLTPAEAMCITDPHRLAFLAAIAASQTYYYLPQWLTQEFVSRLVHDTASGIGLELLRDVFKPMPPGAVTNRHRLRLIAYCKEAVSEILMGNEETAKEWISRLDGVKDIPQVLYIISLSRIVVSDEIKNRIANHCIIGLKAITADFGRSLSDKHSRYNLTSLQLMTPDSMAAMAVFGECLAKIDEEGKKWFKKMLFEIKPLFAGGYDAKSLAMFTTELLLCSFISGAIWQSCMYANEVTTLSHLIDEMGRFIMIPYVHLAERSDAVWDPGYSATQFHPDNPRLLLNHLIKNGMVNKDYHPARIISDNIVDIIHKTSTILWPFERP